MSDDADPPSRAARERVAMRTLLAIGVGLRLLTFLATRPSNRDDHLGVIRYLVDHHALAASNVLSQSYHPPLYYLLAAPLYALSPAGATWPIHLLSLVLSCANLWLIRRLFDDPLVRSLAPAVRVVTFALIATHAPFLRWSSFVSNDPLAYLIGTLCLAAVLRFARSPDARSVTLLAGCVALGLLTKGTFLLAGVALAPIVFARLRVDRAQAAKLTAMFCAIWLVLGSAKYVDNVVRIGWPFVHNLERAGTTPPQLTIWRGPQTAYGVDVIELVRHPIIRPYRPSSYAVTLYATFWYAHLGDDDFRGNVSGYDIIGRATYAVAIVPTLAMLLGCGVALAATRGLFDRDRVARATVLLAALALVVANLAVVVAAGVKFDRWECFQGRLLMQSAMPMAVLVLAGVGRLGDGRAIVRRSVAISFWSLAALGVLYLIVEFALLAHVLPVDETLLFESKFEWAAPK